MPNTFEESPQDRPAAVAIVDDNEADTFFLKYFLEKYGVRTIETFTGGEAFLSALADGSAFSALFLDIRMPKVDGFETFERLQRDFGSQVEDIVFVSAAKNRDDIERVETLSGVKAFIQKPVNVEALVGVFGKAGLA